jgi:catechol 2,3-dioxygenase-like lactoylglutathione lyase family enzyme
MRINVASVLVDDQDKALRFYTEVLGFVKKTEVPLGEARWLTVVSPEETEGTELLLEPDSHPAARPFKRALMSDGIPFASFAVDDVKVGERPLTSKHRRRFEPRRLFWQRPETQWMMWRRRSAGVRTCWDRAVPPVRGVGASRGHVGFRVGVSNSELRWGCPADLDPGAAGSRPYPSHT